MSDPSNALTTAKQGGLTAFSAQNNPFLTATKNEGVDDGLYTRLNGKTGKWDTNYPGLDEFPAGTELIFDLWNADLAYIAFDASNKPQRSKKVSVKSGAAMPAPPFIPGIDPDKWKKQMIITVAAPDTGKTIVLSGKADLPYRNVWKLMQKFGELVFTQPDPGSATGYMKPVVRIGMLEKNENKPAKKVVTNKETGVEEVVSVMEPRQYFLETYEIIGWISEKEMNEIMAENGIAPGAAPAPAAVAQDDPPFEPDPPKVTAQPNGGAAQGGAASGGGTSGPGGSVPLQGEIINPPPGVAPTFRRNRVGGAPGVRTA